MPASGFLKAVPLLASRQAGNLIVAEAGELAKSAGLRSSVRAGREPVDRRPAMRIRPSTRAPDRRGARAKGIATDMEVRQALVDLLGADRRMSRQELAKLALYCHGKSHVTLADVEAVCGDVGGALGR